MLSIPIPFEMRCHKLVSSSSSYVSLQLFYRVLAFSTNFFHLLSWTRVFQFGTFNFRISFLTSSTQRVFGLPIGLLEMGFREYIAFTILVPCILSMWLSQLNLCARMKFIMFLCRYYLIFGDTASGIMSRQQNIWFAFRSNWYGIAWCVSYSE